LGLVAFDCEKVHHQHNERRTAPAPFLRRPAQLLVLIRRSEGYERHHRRAGEQDCRSKIDHENNTYLLTRIGQRDPPRLPGQLERPIEPSGRSKMTPTLRRSKVQRSLFKVNPTDHGSQSVASGNFDGPKSRNLSALVRALIYAARRSSFTSNSLQAEHATTTKPGSPPSLGTVRISFMMSPQQRQRKMGRLSAKTMVLPRVEA
jgi:hypothetical protein